MKNVVVILILSVFISCNMNRNNYKNFTSEIEAVFDSTYYFMLKEAYANNDTIQLNAFFEKWSEASLIMKMKNESPMAKILNDIYIEIYHPFSLEKYGWLARPHYSKYKYAILPTEIEFKIIDFNSIKKEEHWFGFDMNMDTLKEFYPNPNLGRAGRLLDIDPFKKSMNLFLEEDSYEKSSFLMLSDNINTPISYDWKAYRTTPEVYYVLINEQLNKAIAYLRIISTYVSIELSFKNNKWNVEEINTIAIE